MAGRKSGHDAARTATSKKNLVERTHSPIREAHCVPCYPDGFLISEYDLPALLKRHEHRADSKGHRQLDVLHDTALVKALRDSYYVGGNVVMTGYGWDDEDSRARLRARMSPGKRSPDSGRRIRAAQRSLDANGDPNPLAALPGAEAITGFGMDLKRESCVPGHLPSLPQPLTLPPGALHATGTLSTSVQGVTSAVSELATTELEQAKALRHRQPVNPHEDSTYVFSKDDGHKAGKGKGWGGVR